VSHHSPVVFEVPGFWDFKNSRLILIQALILVLIQALILILIQALILILILIQTLIFDQDSETRP
jgi:hypothetical protein